MKPKVEEQGEEDDIVNAANMLKQEREVHEQQLQLYQQNLYNFEKRIAE